MRVFAFVLLSILILGVKKEFTDAAIRREVTAEDIKGLDQDEVQKDNVRALGDHYRSYSYVYHHHHDHDHHHHGSYSYDYHHHGHHHHDHDHHHHDHHFHHYEIYVSSKGGGSKGFYPPSKSGKSKGGKGKGGKGKGGKGHYIFYHGWPVEGSYPPSKAGKGSKGAKGGKGKSSVHGYGW
jgi:hypothetical protein